MAAPGAGELVRALLRDEEVAPQRGGDLRLRRLLLPGEVRRVVLRVVLEEREEDADLEVPVRELLDLGDAVGDQHAVVRDALEEVGRARVHREDGGLEADEAAHEEVLQVRERRDVAGHDLVADELLELGDARSGAPRSARTSPRTRASRPALRAWPR